MAVLVNERKAPGSCRVEFDGLKLASGVYFYRLTVGQYVECRKMVLMKQEPHGHFNIGYVISDISNLTGSSQPETSPRCLLVQIHSGQFVHTRTIVFVK